MTDNQSEADAAVSSVIDNTWRNNAAKLLFRVTITIFVLILACIVTLVLMGHNDITALSILIGADSVLGYGMLRIYRWLFPPICRGADGNLYYDLRKED